MIALLLTKTTWIGLVSLIHGLYAYFSNDPAAPEVNEIVEQATAMFEIFLGAGLITLRHSQLKNGAVSVVPNSDADERMRTLRGMLLPCLLALSMMTVNGCSMFENVDLTRDVAESSDGDKNLIRIATAASAVGCTAARRALKGYESNQSAQLALGAIQTQLRGKNFTADEVRDLLFGVKDPNMRDAFAIALSEISFHVAENEVIKESTVARQMIDSALTACLMALRGDPIGLESTRVGGDATSLQVYETLR